MQEAVSNELNALQMQKARFMVQIAFSPPVTMGCLLIISVWLLTKTVLTKLNSSLKPILAKALNLWQKLHPAVRLHA